VVELRTREPVAISALALVFPIYSVIHPKDTDGNKLVPFAPWQRVKAET